MPCGILALLPVIFFRNPGGWGRYWWWTDQRARSPGLWSHLVSSVLLQVQRQHRKKIILYKDDERHPCSCHINARDNLSPWTVIQVTSMYTEATIKAFAAPSRRHQGVAGFSSFLISALFLVHRIQYSLLNLPSRNGCVFENSTFLSTCRSVNWRGDHQPLSSNDERVFNQKTLSKFMENGISFSLSQACVSCSIYQDLFGDSELTANFWCHVRFFALWTAIDLDPPKHLQNLGPKLVLVIRQRYFAPNKSYFFQYDVYRCVLGSSPWDLSICTAII